MQHLVTPGLTDSLDVPFFSADQVQVVGKIGMPVVMKGYADLVPGPFPDPLKQFVLADWIEPKLHPETDLQGTVIPFP